MLSHSVMVRRSHLLVRCYLGTMCMYTTKKFGSIRKKPEIYALPLKRKPVAGDKNMQAFMNRMPGMNEKIHEDGKEIPWYKAKNVH
jgi:hypothetical protein